MPDPFLTVDVCIHCGRPLYLTVSNEWVRHGGRDGGVCTGVTAPAMPAYSWQSNHEVLDLADMEKVELWLGVT